MDGAVASVDSPSRFPLSSDLRRADTRELVGFRALGRHGELGVVVDPETWIDADDGIAIRGGTSAALLYIVPKQHVRSVQPTTRVVRLDVDLADFVPSLLADGTVELRIAAE